MTLTLPPESAATDQSADRSPNERDRTWGYRPALDGLRAVAVVLVVGYHADVDVLSAGFIGVDLFFVLSGLVVCNALLTELDRTGTIRLTRFYARRVRRLLPAAVTMIVGTCVLYVVTFPLLERTEIVADAQAALLYVANWFAIVQSNDYFAQDGSASPFLHFWSLAIEEQFYLFFPALVLLLTLAGRRRKTTLLPTISLAVLGLLSIALQLWLAPNSASRAYYGTDTRLHRCSPARCSRWCWRSIRRSSPVDTHRRSGRSYHSRYS